jgi:hypothetical protein
MWSTATVVRRLPWAVESDGEGPFGKGAFEYLSEPLSLHHSLN